MLNTVHIMKEPSTIYVYMISTMKSLFTSLALLSVTAMYLQAAQPADHLTFEAGQGAKGSGQGKHIVLLAGDE